VDWHVKGDLAFAEVQIIRAYRKLESNYLFNTGGTEAAITESGFGNLENQFSNEIRLLSSTTGNDDWLVGFYSLHENPELEVGLIRYPLNTSAIILAQVATDVQSLYGEFNWRFSSLWSTKFGLRSTREKSWDANYLFNTQDLLGLQSPTLSQTRPFSSEHNDNSTYLSPQVVLSWTVHRSQESATNYLSITEGFKSGGSNSLSASKSFNPEKVMSYELGHKHVEGGSSWSRSSFYYNYNDLQVLAYEQGVTAINNAASAKIWGAEGTLSITPVTSFSYQIGVAWLQTRYGEFISSVNGQPVDVSGNQMPYAPRWDINQKFTDTGLLRRKTVNLNLFHHYQSQTTFNQFEDPNVTQGALHIFDLVGEWELASDWVLSAGIYNLTDEEYFRNIVTFTTTSKPSAPQGNALGYPEPGRNWDLGARMRF
jgi:iron complex outermembrane recepter protein